MKKPVAAQSLGLLLLLLLTTLSGCDRSMEEHDQTTKSAATRFLDSEGRAWTPADWQAKWLVVNYWATWCGPCRKEVPELNRFDTDYANIAKVVAINFDGTRGEQLREDRQALGIQVTVLADDVANYYQLPRSSVLPVTYIINPKGELKTTLVGPQTAAEIAKHIIEL
ncbi:thiol-disulfide isomerase/thioredoxin [Sinobacterium caligoides]|uniref:Thiol-disulfide isomerase/thioredoxin n=1 Tax=Sinobacterium caligoides TaxID=933926 RepID=A0A3N2DMY4_9GAMM|nr:TlpA disulfide reductase family protein [Sinobacterium caligoides]ROS01171.1 thiol-disulfide isomerase/thioredoxin [Sinobacterium caligoides]